MSEDLYKILELERNASESDIKKNYRRLSKKHHPDMGGDEEMFKKISYAYDVLSDKEKKSNYDRFGDPKGQQFQQFDPFGRGFRHQQQRRGQDLRLNITINLEDVHNGAHKKIKYNRFTP